MQISLNIIDIFMSTYFLLDPFELPYYFYCILGELIYVLSIVACIPSTFLPDFGFNLYYPVEEIYNAPFRHKFNSSAFKKTFMLQQHNYGKFLPTTQQY